MHKNANDNNSYIIDRFIFVKLFSRKLHVSEITYKISKEKTRKKT